MGAHALGDDATSINEQVTLNVAEANRLADYLKQYYETHPQYDGGEFLHLRLNPDMDTGALSTGWSIYSGENQPGIGPSMRMTIQSKDRVFVYISIGGVIHRLDTGLGAPPQ